MLIVAGDAHIGSGASLGRLPDQESSWTRLCVTACEMEADVLGTGDWLHHRKPSPSEVDAFQSGLRILRDGGRRFVSVAGNHEIVSEDAPSCLETACAGFDAVAHRGPAIVELDGIVVGFLPWAPPRLNAVEASEALMTVAAELREQGAEILIAHHAIAGGSLPTGLPVLDLAEPTLDPHALAAMGYEVVIAGHIHRRQVILGDGVCLIAQCGPLARTSFGEAGVETGGWQIEGPRGADETLNGLRVGATASPFDVPDRPFVAIECDVRDSVDPTDWVMSMIGANYDVRDAIVRCSWVQDADEVVDANAIREHLLSLGAHRIDTLTPIIERAASVRSAGVNESTDPRESWDRYAEGQEIPEGIKESVREEAHARIARVA